MLLLAGAVPGFAQFAAATHMGDGKGHAALQQAQARVREPRVEAFAIGAVAIQVQRHGLAQVLAAAHQADRHPGAVRCGSPQALADIVVGIERPQHRGLLEHRLGTAGQLQLAYLGRAVECFVAQAQAWAGELQAVLHVQAVGRVRQFDAVGRQALRAYLDDRQAAFAQAQGQRAGIQAEALEHDRVAVRHQHLPLFTAGHRRDRGVVQGEVDAVLVGADEPAPLAVELAVVGEVLVAFDPWRQAGERCLRGFRVQYPGFAGGLAVEQQHQLAFGAGAVAVQEEAPVGLLEHGLRAFVAQGVATQAPRAVGVVQFGEEQRLAVVGPGQAAVAVVEGQGSDAATGQVLHVQGEDFVAAGVQAVGQQAVVGADVERAKGQETAIGQGVGVEQQLLLAFIDRVGVVGRARAAVVTRVLVARGGTGVVQVGAPGRRQRQVGFQDAALDLFEQLFAQRRLVGQAGFLVGVLGLQVGKHLGGVALLQPGVRVAGLGLVGNRGLGLGWH
ncbi:hypothetical protein D3C76_810440 [compost metagenome]